MVDQVQPVRLHSRGAKQGAAGMGCPADPLEGKRRAQARNEGVLEARLGSVALAAGSDVTLNLNNGSLSRLPTNNDTCRQGS